MFNFRKVKPMEDGNENKTQIKKDQANYEDKVRTLQKACKNFGDYLKGVNEETKFVDIAKAFADKDTGFKDQMKKSWLLSRTSRRLQEMKKNLSKSKSKTFDPQKIDDFVKCFEFEREKLNNKGNIKRSAIDDKKVYDFFNENSKGSIREILSVKQNEAQKESNALDKKAKTVFGQANESLDASEEARDEATDVQNGMEKTRKSVRSDREIEPETKRESVKLLDGKVGKLEQDKSESQQATQKLKKQQKETERIIKDENSTPRERMGSLDALRQATVANNAATGKLNGTVDKAEEVHAEVEKDIEEAKAKPFDSKTKTFTVETEADFEKIIPYQSEILKMVVKGDSVKQVPRLLFWGNKSLTSIDFGSVTTIHYRAIADCKNLLNINLRNVEIIEESAFGSCSSLTSIDLQNVKTVGEGAFGGCTKLTDINLSSTCEKIVPREFVGCNQLVSINIKNVKTIENDAFHDCELLQKINLENVKTIGDRAFADCKRLSSVNLRSIETIGKSAFFECINLGSVTLGENAKTIDVGAFMSCEGLNNINLGSATTIKTNAFKNCGIIGAIDLQNVETIEYFAFSGCGRLTGVKLKNVTTIEEGVFYNCAELASIDLGNVQTIQDSAFKGCTGLTTVTLPTNEKAKEIRDIICKQTGKTAGDGNNNTIKFFNDPDQVVEKPAAATQET